MRTATILAAAVLAAGASAAAPPETITFAEPLLDRPADLEKFAQTWPDVPALAQPFLQPNEEPQPAGPPTAQEHREPYSEEWRCFVPLQRAQPRPADEAVEPSRCQTPSLEPDHLFHLL